MKLMLATAHPFIPQIAGGAQSSTNELALRLRARGHEVAVLAGLTTEGWIGLRARVLMKLLGAKAVRDTSLGYPTYRAWHPRKVVDEIVLRDRPDVVLLQSGYPVPIAQAFQRHGVATVLYLRNVEFDDLGGDPRALGEASGGQVACIANSNFTAERFKQSFGLEASIIHPIFEADRYRTDSRRTNVTFINPHPLKGLDIALAIADRCPDIPFSFVEAWTLSESERVSLLRRLRNLPNVTLMQRTRDMRQVYGNARFVLAPSQWEEAFGRIASEAHYSGIPVIATRCGGLPEAVGPGGVLVERNASIDEWVEAVRSLWDDESRYQAVSRAAEIYSRRPELDPDRQIERVIETLNRAYHTFKHKL